MRRKGSRLKTPLRLLAVLLAATALADAAFTCQGDSFDEASSNCPDSGAQRHSSGGNVVVTLVLARGLPDRDAWGANAGTSDPYVQVRRKWR